MLTASLQSLSIDIWLAMIDKNKLDIPKPFYGDRRWWCPFGFSCFQKFETQAIRGDLLVEFGWSNQDLWLSESQVAILNCESCQAILEFAFSMQVHTSKVELLIDSLKGFSLPYPSLSAAESATMVLSKESLSSVEFASSMLSIGVDLGNWRANSVIIDVPLTRRCARMNCNANHCVVPVRCRVIHTVWMLDWRVNIEFSLISTVPNRLAQSHRFTRFKFRSGIRSRKTIAFSARRMQTL